MSPIFITFISSFFIDMYWRKTLVIPFTFIFAFLMQTHGLSGLVFGNSA